MSMCFIYTNTFLFPAHPPSHTPYITNHVFCAGHHIALSCQKIEAILIHILRCRRQQHHQQQHQQDVVVVYSNRCGAEGARGAHNSEVRCSNHLAGIYTLSALKKPTVIAHATYKLEYRVPGMAQGQRARLITLRTQDRNLLPG